MGIKNILTKGAHSDKFYLILSQIVFSGGSFLTQFILARALGIKVFGMYAAMLLVLYFVLGTIGSFTVAPFQVLYAHERRKKKYISSLLAILMLICILCGVIIYGLCYLPIEFLSKIQPLNVHLALFIITFILHDFVRRALITKFALRAALILDIISESLQLILFGVLWYYELLSLELALTVIIATNVPAILYGLWIIAPVRFSLSDCLYTLRLHWKHGKWLVSTSILQWGAANYLNVLGGIYLGMEALGVLQLTRTAYGILNAVLQMIENYVIPSASKFLKESKEKCDEYIEQVGKLVMVFSIPVFVLVIVFAEQIITFLGGESFGPYAYVLQLITILHFFILAAYPLRVGIRVLLLNKVFFISYLISFMITLVIAKYLVMQFGITGVVVGLILNQLIHIVIFQATLQKNKFNPWKLSTSY